MKRAKLLLPTKAIREGSVLSARDARIVDAETGEPLLCDTGIFLDIPVDGQIIATVQIAISEIGTLDEQTTQPHPIAKEEEAMASDIKVQRVECEQLVVRKEGNKSEVAISAAGDETVGVWFTREGRTTLAINQVSNSYTSIEFYDKGQKLDYAIGITGGEPMLQFGTQQVPIAVLKSLLVGNDASAGQTP